MPDLSGVFDSGLAIGLVTAGVLFFYFKFWPWYSARIAAKDIEEKRRHDQYLASVERGNQLMEKFTDAINAVNMTMHATAQLISDQTNRIDDYHQEILRELRK